MSFNSFIPRGSFGDLHHAEYPTVMQPATRNLGVSGGRGTAGKLSGGRDWSGSAAGLKVNARQLGSYMPYDGVGIPSRDEHCVEPGCSTRLSRYNRGSVCAGCSTRDADRTHR